MFNARAHHRMHKQMTKKLTVPDEDLALYNVCVGDSNWHVYMSGYHVRNHSVSILTDIPQCYWKNVVWIKLLVNIPGDMFGENSFGLWNLILFPKHDGSTMVWSDCLALRSGGLEIDRNMSRCIVYTIKSEIQVL